MKKMYCFRTAAENVCYESQSAIYTPVSGIFEMSFAEFQNDRESDCIDSDGGWKPPTIWGYDTLHMAKMMHHKCEMDAMYAYA